jgi:hypothetical protein
MNLHLNKDNFEGAIAAAAAYLQIPEIFIEKDYWAPQINNGQICILLLIS